MGKIFLTQKNLLCRSAVFFILLTQSCSEEKELIEARKTLEERAIILEKNAKEKQSEPIGHALYKEHCQSCHGSLIESQKKGKTKEEIKASIDNIEIMQYIKLTDTEIGEIALALHVEKVSQGARLYNTHCKSCHGSLIESKKLGRTSRQIKLALSVVSPMMEIKLSKEEIRLIAVALGGEKEKPGESLYENHCASCHGSLEVSTKKRRTKEQIKASIMYIDEMKHIDLTDSQLSQIADLLKAGGVSNETTSNDESAEQDLASKLYTKKCASCHGVLPETNIPGRTFEQITFATEHIPQMKHILLTEKEARAIADALKTQEKETSPSKEDPNETKNETASTQQPTEPTDREKGEALYKTYCSSCHGVVETSTKKDRSASIIESSIASIGAMKYLSHLSSEQVMLIAEALKTPIAIDYTPLNLVTLPNRGEIESEFRELFEYGAPSSARAGIFSKINALINNKSAHFNSYCSQRSQKTKCSYLTHNLRSSSSPNRQAARLVACDEVLALDNALKSFLSQIGVLITDEPNPTLIERAFNFYFQGVALPDKVKESFLDHLGSAGYQSLSTSQRWRSLLLPMCKSTLREVL